MDDDSNRIAKLKQKLEDYMERNTADSEDKGDSYYDDNESASDDNHEDFLGILKDACNLIRGADRLAPDFQDLVDKVDALINAAIGYAYGDGDLYDFIPSFTHSDANPELCGRKVRSVRINSSFCSSITILILHIGSAYGDLQEFFPVLREKATRCVSLALKMYNL